MNKKISKAGALDSASETLKQSSTKATRIQINKATENETPLNDKQQKLLAECEADIQENLRGTFVVGWRLEQIRDQKLYRGEDYNTFDAYCRGRWDFSKSHANRHIQAYLCEKHLKSVKDVEVYVPTKESQVRFMADLKPEQWVEVASKVREKVGDGQASAGDFGEARHELYPKPKSEAKPGKADTKPVEETVTAPKIDTKLVSFSKLKSDADRLYMIFNSPTGKQEGLKIITNFQKVLGKLADTQISGKEVA